MGAAVLLLRNIVRVAIHALLVRVVRLPRDFDPNRTISIGLQLGSRQGQQSAILKELGSDLEHLPERVAKMALEALGLGRAEAEKIAYRPLPTMELPIPADEFRAGEVSAMPRAAQPPPARRNKRGAQRTTG